MGRFKRVFVVWCGSCSTRRRKATRTNGNKPNGKRFVFVGLPFWLFWCAAFCFCFSFLGYFAKPQPTRNDSSTANRILHFSCGQRCAFHFSCFLPTHAQEESQLQGSELTATIGIVHDYATAKLFTSIPTRARNFIVTRFFISA